MSGSLNKVMLIGNLGADPEIRHTNDNRAIANLRIATSERWKDQSGSQQERTEWHRVVVFGALAEIVEKYLKKGDSAYFEGKIQTRKWTDKEGQERYTTEVVVDRNGVMQMLGSASGRGASSSMPAYDDGYEASSSSPAANGGGRTQKITDDAPFDDDIPF